MSSSVAILTRRGRVAAIIAVGASLAVPLSAQAASPASLTPKWLNNGLAEQEKAAAVPIPITNWSWGIENPARIRRPLDRLHPPTGPTPRATFNTFKFTKPVDSTSPLFLLMAGYGDPWLDKVRVSVPLSPTAPNDARRLEFCLKTVYVTKVAIQAGDGPTLTEDIELRFEAASEAYYDEAHPLPQGDDTGTLPKGDEKGTLAKGDEKASTLPKGEDTGITSPMRIEGWDMSEDYQFSEGC